MTKVKHCSWWLAGIFVVALLAILTPLIPAHETMDSARAAVSPIQHIVVLDLENHSFDNVLGFWCQTSPRCGPGDAMPASVTLSNGAVVTPTTDPDVVPSLNHSMASQLADMNIQGGIPQMNGWQNTPSRDCSAVQKYRCISGYQASQVPNITTLAAAFAMNDRFFSFKDSPSWGGHIYAVAATTDGFTGDNPAPLKGVTQGPGWGCDSNMVAKYGTSGPNQPSCIPDFTLGLPNGGAFEPTKALYVPTIMDRLDAAGLTWRIYGATNAGSPGTVSQNGYIWSVCPTFSECLNTSQDAGLVDSGQFLTDAAAGTLPNFSLITAGGSNLAGSCHNGFSMTACDNYVGQVASAVESSPEWSSTALIITWDDYGGFYDSAMPGLNPDSTQQGIRLPLIVVSPYAVPESTDATPATFASILALTEQTFGLPPLEENDSSAYPLTAMFNLSAGPSKAPRPRMVIRPVPKSDHIQWSQARQDT